MKKSIDAQNLRNVRFGILVYGTAFVYQLLDLLHTHTYYVDTNIDLNKLIFSFMIALLSISIIETFSFK